jgi:hypothetical protein
MYGRRGCWADRYMGRYMGSEKTNQYKIVPTLACVCEWSDEMRNTGRQVNNKWTDVEATLSQRSVHVYPNFNPLRQTTFKKSLSKNMREKPTNTPIIHSVY